MSQDAERTNRNYDKPTETNGFPTSSEGFPSISSVSRCIQRQIYDWCTHQSQGIGCHSPWIPDTKKWNVDA